MGKVMVSTRFLAHDYYMDNSNSIVVKHSLTPVVDAKAPFYTADQMWSRPDMEDYIKGLQRAYLMYKNKTGELKDMKAAARKTIIDQFSPDVVTKHLVEILKGIPAPQLQQA
jgi:hypothetical protein